MAYSGDCKNREVRIFHESLDELSTDLADHIAELSDDSVKERGVFSIALSGGSLIGLLGKLCQVPYKTTIDWSKWYVFWADERIVSKSHSDSNYKLAKDALLSKVPIIPSHVHSINNSVSAEEAADEYEFMIRQLVKSRTINVSNVSDCPKFDLILLGIESDGHVAALFPGHPILHLKEEWVAFITDSPKPPPDRITLTLPVINSASNVAIVGTGKCKAEIVHAIVDDVGPDCSMHIPAMMVKPRSGKLVWFLDKHAASKLDSYKISEFSD